jgi:hypothetical protein
MSDPASARTPVFPAELNMPLRIRAAVWAAIVVAASAGLYFFYSRGLTDVYGDAMAHMEGARRLFDSLTPGYEEIGTVWLPLPHLLAAPLAINDYLWRTGLAGSFISTAAFIVTAWFACRLAAEMNREVAAGVVALAGFLLCPNMLYLASTPLTEPLAILWMVLMAYGLFRYQESGSIWALIGAGAAAFCGTWTRYDGWSVLPFAALFVLLARQNPRSFRQLRERAPRCGCFTTPTSSATRWNSTMVRIPPRRFTPTSSPRPPSLFPRMEASWSQRATIWKT